MWQIIPNHLNFFIKIDEFNLSVLNMDIFFNISKCIGSLHKIYYFNLDLIIVKLLFFKQKHPIKSILQYDSEGLDKISLRKKILYNLDNLNVNDTTNFLKIYLKTNKFYSTKIFVRFLLKEAELLNNRPDYDKRMLYRLRRIPTKLMKEGLIEKFNSQVYKIV